MVRLGLFNSSGMILISSLPSGVEIYFPLSRFIKPLFKSVVIIDADVADVPILYFFISWMIVPGVYLDGGFVLPSYKARPSTLTESPLFILGKICSSDDSSISIFFFSDKSLLIAL